MLVSFGFHSYHMARRVEFMKKTSLLYSVIPTLIVFALLSGCVSSYTKGLSEEDKAKQFQINEDTSLLYVFRSEGFASEVVVPIWLDGSPVAQTSARSFLVLELEPGLHTITSKTAQESSLSLVTEPGSIYFFWQELKVGFTSPRSKLHQVSAEKGKDRVRRCKLIKGYL